MLTRRLLILTVIACSSSALAADPSVAQENSSGKQLVQDSGIRLLSADASPRTNSLVAHSYLYGTTPVASQKAQGIPLSKMEGDVCFKMRTYKVKPKERFHAGENSLKGYSTCEMASNYKLQDAIATPKAAKSAVNK